MSTPNSKDSFFGGRLRLDDAEWEAVGYAARLAYGGGVRADQWWEVAYAALATANRIAEGQAAPESTTPPPPSSSTDDVPLSPNAAYLRERYYANIAAIYGNVPNTLGATDWEFWEHATTYALDHPSSPGGDAYDVGKCNLGYPPWHKFPYQAAWQKAIREMLAHLPTPELASTLSPNAAYLRERYYVHREHAPPHNLTDNECGWWERGATAALEHGVSADAFDEATQGPGSWIKWREAELDTKAAWRAAVTDLLKWWQHRTPQATPATPEPTPSPSPPAESPSEPILRSWIKWREATKPACETCRYFDHQDGRHVATEGNCCRRAPVVWTNGRGGVRHNWPIVWFEDWCGEYETRPQPQQQTERPE